MYNLNHLLDNIQTCFGIDSFYVYSGNAIQSNKKQHYCESCPLNIHNKCMQSWQIGSDIAKQLNSPYIYFCPLGLTFIIIAKHINISCLQHDYLVAGPIVVDSKSMIYNQQRSDSIVQLIKSNRQYDENALSHIAALIFLSYNGVIFKNMESGIVNPEQYDFKYTSMFMMETYHLRNVFANISALAEMLFGKQSDKPSEIDEVIQQIVDIVWLEEMNNLHRTKSKLGQIVCYIYNKYRESGFQGIEERMILKSVNAINEADNFADSSALFHEAAMLMYHTIDTIGLNSHVIIQSLQSILSEHYAEALSLSEISKKLNVSYAYLSSLINKELGKGFNTYLKEVRVKKSATFLKNNDYSIADIAAMVGFADQSHFAKSFRAFYGLSPSQYRAKSKSVAH